MQLRISQGPLAALGVSEGATLEQVRSAFLALTKQFHPARFGRLSIELQRLSNEVFLGIKAAHDALAKALGGGKRAAMQSGGMPVIHPEGSGHLPQQRTTGPIPTTQPRPATPPAFARGTERPSTPAISRTSTPMQPARTSTPPLGTPIQRPATPPVQRPASVTGSRPGTPPGRPPTPSAAINPDTVRGVVGPREPAFDERAALRESLMLVNEQNWAAARQSLSTLATKVPASKNYRALLGYVRGREVQAAGRADEAALEYQRALELDPGLTMAKQALADVQRRR